MSGKLSFKLYPHLRAIKTFLSESTELTQVNYENTRFVVFLHKTISTWHFLYSRFAPRVSVLGILGCASCSDLVGGDGGVIQLVECLPSMREAPGFHPQHCI